MLLDNGLIEYEEGRQTYRITEKGIRLVTDLQSNEQRIGYLQ